MQVGHINFRVFGQMSVLHGDEDSFLEKVLVDEAAVSLGHQHSEIQSKENL